MLITLFLSAAVLAGAQEASPSVPASLSTAVTAAATTVPATSSDAGVDLLEFETKQLTPAVVASLADDSDIAEYAYLFAFDNSTTTPVSKRASNGTRSMKCKSAPGDSTWPSSLVWGIFDLLTGGAVEPIIPVASVCYQNSTYKNYDEAECSTITAGWTSVNGSTHYDDPGSMMFPLYTGQTCLPPSLITDSTAPKTCTQGGYSAYSVEASNVAQIQLAVNFARVANLRLVVKNTGHDYNGRSTGEGALSIWTHKLKGIQYIEDFTGSTYSGPVFKIGAGVQGFELYEAADKYGVTAVSGICPTVGVAGGYSAGGGHSPVMQLFGMGSDQVVALEVVTASGLFVTASPSVNSDLYWAMLGGGGGTYGIVTSAVVKVHEKVDATVQTWSFTSIGISEDTFWAGIRAFWDDIPTYNEAKTYSYASVINIGGGAYMYTMAPFFSTKHTVEQHNALLKPYFDKLAALNITVDAQEPAHYDTFYPAYKAGWGSADFHIGSTQATPGVRLISKANFEDEALSNQTFEALKVAAALSVVVTLYHQAPAAQDEIVNSVNPAFRDEAAMFLAVNSLNDTSVAGLEAAHEIWDNEIMGPMREATKGSGAYGNEADPWEPEWQQSFWGDNYDRLLSIKKEWDPTGLFYVHHGVGSESWEIQGGDQGVPTQDGKLCLVS